MIMKGRTFVAVFQVQGMDEERSIPMDLATVTNWIAGRRKMYRELLASRRWWRVYLETASRPDLAKSKEPH